MRGNIPGYQLVTTSSVADALDVLASEPGIWKPFAGGTDLMVLLESGNLRHRNYINIWNLKELREISVSNDYVVLGALTTYTAIQSNEILKKEFPMLCQAASETGGLAIQNRGTLGGNIINASPAADSPPALLAYDAELELTLSTGSRWIPYHGFHTGYKQMQIRNDELLTKIRLPRKINRSYHYYRKVGTRKAQAISKVCLAAIAQTNNNEITDLRIAFGSVAPIVIRCSKTEDALRGQRLNESVIELGRQTLTNEIAPIDDIRSTAAYRLQVATNLLADFLKKLQSQ